MLGNVSRPLGCMKLRHLHKDVWIVGCKNFITPCRSSANSAKIAATPWRGTGRKAGEIG